MPRTRRYSWIVYGLYGFGLAILAWFWWHGSASDLASLTGFYRAFGRASALIAAYAILWEFLLISRAPLFEKHMSLEGALKFHKWNGYASILFLLFHIVFTALGYAIPAHTNVVNQFLQFNITYEDVLRATYAAVLFITAVGISIAIARQYFKYETWYLVHVSTYLAILLAFGHQAKNGVDFIKQPNFVIFWWALNIFVAAVVGYYRFFLPLWRSWYYRLHVTKVATEAPNIYSIFIGGRHLESFPLEAGQFGVWRFLTPNVHAWQGHPFSFSSRPGDSTLRLSFKTSGDFTAELPQVGPGTPVLLDGPYGKFTVGALQRSKVLMIAGGIGVTPIVALLKVLPHWTRDITVIYAAQTENDLALRAEMEAAAKEFGIKVYYVISDKNYSGLTGYVDAEKLTQLVPDLLDREVMLCGPPPMMSAVRKSLKDLGLDRRYIHYENFSF